MTGRVTARPTSLRPGCTAGVNRDVTRGGILRQSKATAVQCDLASLPAFLALEDLRIFG